MSITPALKDAFEAFNILYYPIAETDEELAAAVAQADDADMAFAVTSAGNMKGTGYILPPSDVFLLAGVHHSLAGQSGRAVADAQTPNPAADIRDLVPAITVVPMYPGFPQEVLEIDEALFRFHQMIHYASTYGIEYISALVGTPVTVSRGWRPHDGDAPQAGDAATDTSDDYAIFVDAKVVKLVLSTERMRGVVLERLAQPTRMHEAEVRCAAHVLAAPGQDGFVDIAFHENMLGLVQVAAEGTGDELVRMLKRTAQHPGDVLKAITFVRNNRPDEKKHLANRQKRAFCEVLEGFTYNQLATNIAQAKPADRLSLNYLSLARFGGETLKKAVADVESGQVKSWNSKVEQQWKRLALDGPEPLLALYGEKPGMLLRSLTRLVKRGVPLEQIEQAVSSSTEYSLATLVRTLTIMSGEEPVIISIHQHPHENESHFNWRKQHQHIAFQKTARIIRGMLVLKLATLETPLRGKRVFVDSISGTIPAPPRPRSPITSRVPIPLPRRTAASMRPRSPIITDRPTASPTMQRCASSPSGTTRRNGWMSTCISMRCSRMAPNGMSVGTATSVAAAWLRAVTSPTATMPWSTWTLTSPKRGRQLCKAYGSTAIFTTVPKIGAISAPASRARPLWNRRQTPRASAASGASGAIAS